MWWYLGTIFVISFGLWILSGFLQQMVERERKDPNYAKKMDKHRNKWIPKLDFIENLFVWCFGIALIIAFIYFQ